MTTFFSTITKFVGPPSSFCCHLSCASSHTLLTPLGERLTLSLISSPHRAKKDILSFNYSGLTPSLIRGRIRKITKTGRGEEVMLQQMDTKTLKLVFVARYKQKIKTEFVTTFPIYKIFSSALYQSTNSPLFADDSHTSPYIQQTRGSFQEIDKRRISVKKQPKKG